MSTYALQSPGKFSSAIREARSIWGYSQRELAVKADVSKGFVSELERGKQTVQLNHFLKVCQALDLDFL